MIKEENKTQNFYSIIKITKEYKTLFLGLTCMFGLYVLPIIIANRYYCDDNARSLTGLTGWNGDGRPLTESLMKLLSGGMPITDISPLPLILSVLLLAYTITLYYKTNLSHFTFHISHILFFSLVIMNPFMLTNLSYKFDVLSMVLSLCLTFIPFIMPRNSNAIAIIITSIVCLVAALSLYQVVICAFCSLVLLDIFLMIINSNISIKRTLSIGTGMCFGVIIYKKAIANKYLSYNDWRYDASKMLLGSDKTTLQKIQDNVSSLLSIIKTYFIGIPKTVIFLMLLGTVSALIYIIYTIIKSNKPHLHKAIKCVYILILPVLLVVANILPLSLVNGGGGKCRILLSMCIVELFFAILFLLLSQKSNKTAVLLIIPCIIFFYSYSYSFGNAEKSQKNYEEYLTYNIARDIETINSNNTYHNISFLGTTPRSPQLIMLAEKYPQFNSLVPTYLNSGWWCNGSALSHYLQNQDFDFVDPSEEISDIVSASTPLIETSVYSCFCVDDSIIIKYKD